jgi:hypothetical protein
VRTEGFNAILKGKGEGETTRKTSEYKRNKPTEEEIDELEYKLRYGRTKEDKPLT